MTQNEFQRNPTMQSVLLNVAKHLIVVGNCVSHYEKLLVPQSDNLSTYPHFFILTQPILSQTIPFVLLRTAKAYRSD